MGFVLRVQPLDRELTQLAMRDRRPSDHRLSDRSPLRVDPNRAQ
jgi:hypothetical protein